LHEFQRRNVFRAAAAYLVIAWVIIQVAETILPAFRFDDTAVRTVVILLAIGFLPAMVLAWIFEWTPEGLRREREVDHQAPSLVALAKRADRIIMIVLAFGLAYFAFDKFVQDPIRDESLAQEARGGAMVESYGNMSIAVLPFVNMSADPENEYFSDGISEELLNLLSQIPELRVISRSSSFSFKEKDISIPEVAAQLNVPFILEGSVRRAGEHVRITAQLVEGRSDTHLWSETYDRMVNDIFAVQDEISAAIVEELKPRMGLVPLPQNAPTAVVTENPEAHDAYLRGRYLFRQRSIEGAAEALEEAVELDPNFAPAQAELALAYRFMPLYLDLPKDKWVNKARPHAQRALELAPALAEAHAAMGYVLVYPETIDQAIDYFRSAVKLNPNYADAHKWLADFLDTTGRQVEAFEEHLKALELDPLSVTIRADVITGLVLRGHLEQADRELERLRTLDLGAYQLSMITRRSLGGNWADGALAALVAWSSNDGEDPPYELLPLLAVLDFPEESWPEMAKSNALALTLSGQPSRVAELGAETGSGVGEFDFALALAGAGEFKRARPLLEKAWDFSRKAVHREWFTEYHVMALRASRLKAESPATSDDLFEALNRSVEQAARAGLINMGLYWDADFQAGIAEWLNGRRENALRLIRNAVEHGYFVYPGEVYLQDLYDDPGFAAIRQIQQQRQERERAKFLAVICEDNPYAQLWSPPEDACGSQ